MRIISFNSFLAKYLKDLSICKSNNVHKLCKELKKNYRLLDSLLLYCALFDKRDLFNKYTKGKYKEIINQLNIDNFLSDRFKDQHDFKKIWISYQNYRNGHDFENQFKDKIRSNTIKIMKIKQMSNYRVYTDLKLNPGNINDYITNGNVNKVSLEMAKLILEYVQNY